MKNYLSLIIWILSGMFICTGALITLVLVFDPRVTKTGSIGEPFSCPENENRLMIQKPIVIEKNYIYIEYKYSDSKLGEAIAVAFDEISLVIDEKNISANTNWVRDFSIFKVPENINLENNQMVWSAYIRYGEGFGDVLEKKITCQVSFEIDINNYFKAGNKIYNTYFPSVDSYIITKSWSIFSKSYNLAVYNYRTSEYVRYIKIPDVDLEFKEVEEGVVEVGYFDEGNNYQKLEVIDLNSLEDSED